MRERTALGMASAMSAALVVAVLALPVSAANCRRVSTGLIPLIDLGSDEYQGHQGGLYPDGSNLVPEEHLALGMRLSANIVPRDENGAPDPDGAIGLVAIGMSNTRDEFDGYITLATADPDTASNVVIVNGAQGARDLDNWANSPGSNPWRNLESNIRAHGLTPAQVQAVWVYIPDRSRGTADFALAEGQGDQMTLVMNYVSSLYPNVAVAYWSSREYSGYSNNGEPRSYQHAFTVKWFIERQINGDPAINPDPKAGPVTSPWVAWGPYTWADGTTPRSDGLFYECSDFENDGVHPTIEGGLKIGALLVDHFETHPTATPWYSGTAPAPTTTEATTSTATIPTTGPTDTSQPTATVTSTSEPTGTTSASATTRADEGPGRGVWWLAAGLALGLILSIALVAGRRREAEEPPDQPVR